MNKGTQIVQVRKKPWLVGLWWQKFPTTKGLKHEGRRLIKTMLEQDQDDSILAINSLVVRTAGVAQVGYGTLQDSRIPALPSLASALAGAKPTNWIGRFPLAGGIWVVAVVNGDIHPDGDFFGDEEGAEDALAICRDASETWDDIYQAEDEEESLRIIDQLLPTRAHAREGKTIPLKPQFPLQRVVKVAATSAVIGGVWFGISSYFDHRAEVERQQQIEAARIAMQAQQQEAMAGAQDNSWKNLPSVTGMLELCRDEFSTVPAVRYGWEITRWECSPSGTQTGWKQGVRGGFEYFPEGLSIDPRSPFSGTVTASFGGDAIAMVTTQELLPFAQSLPALYESARVARQTLKIEWPAPPLPVAEGEAPGAAPAPKIQWEVSEFKQFPPLDFGAMLEQIPGLAVEKIEWVREAQKWTIKGVLYGKG